MMAMLAHKNNWAHRVGGTPMRCLDVGFGRTQARICPGGSIEDRTAIGRVRAGIASGRVRVGARVIESTSGNLGAALACLSCDLGMHFTAVVDPKTTAANIKKIRVAAPQKLRLRSPHNHLHVNQRVIAKRREGV